jgi:membrane protein implicated in regulation of membrane protease activity
MEELLNLLFWIGALAGVVLILLLLLSIFSGLEIGGDIDTGTSLDAHSDGGALGPLKTVLAFAAVGAFTARAVFLNTAWSWGFVAVAAILAGLAAVLLLSWFFRWLLKNQEEGNWHAWQAEGKVGIVYVPIPEDGKGRITVAIEGADRELAAKSQDGSAIGSRAKVLVIKAEEDCVIVLPYDEN